MKRFNTRTFLGVFRRASGEGTLTISSADVDNSSAPVMNSDSAVNVAQAAVSATSSEFERDAEPYADNDDPLKVRFKKLGVKKLIRRWRQLVAITRGALAYAGDLASPKLEADEKIMMVQRFRRWHPDELDEHRRKKSDAKIFDVHRQQAKLLESRIIEKLTQLRFCYFITKNEQVHVKKRITFSHVEVSPYAYVYHVRQVPFGVKFTDIAQEWVTNELCATVNKRVRIELDTWGLRITVEVASTLSIPNFVQFKDMIDSFPKTAAPLSFVVGQSTNGALVYRNLSDAPHMIVAGTTGAGKSNEENVIITSIIHRNDPRLVKLVLFDMKGGVEFNFYEDLPHLLSMTSKDWSSSGVIERKHDVIPALRWLLRECEHRLQVIKAAKVKNIQEFNRGKRIDKKIPHILMVFDEWAVISKSEHGKEAQILMGELGNISRSVGYNIVLCTQYPNAEILNPTIAVNFDWRIAFNMTTGASQSVLGGSWDAAGLSPVGRAIFHTSEGNMQVQTPRITNGNIEAIVEGIKSGSANIAGMMGVDLTEIFEWSLNNVAGKLDVETVFNQYRERISKDNLRSLLKSSDGKVFDVQGTLYRVVNSIGGQRARHLEIAEGEGLPVENSDSRTPITSLSTVAETDETKIGE